MLTVMFKKPVYVKHSSATGAPIPGYIFEASAGTAPLTVCITEPQTEVSLLQGGLRDQHEWWLGCVREFLAVANQHFTKKYAPETLIRHFKHGGLDNSTPVTDASVIIFIPKHVLLSEGQFIMMWTVEKTKIDVPDLEEEMVQLSINDAAASGLEGSDDGPSEIDADSLPVDTTATEWQAPAAGGFGGSSSNGAKASHSRQYEKRKVREARLKAKLAQYKAEKAISRYLEKYGGDMSDSDASDWVSADEEDSSEDAD